MSAYTTAPSWIRSWINNYKTPIEVEINCSWNKILESAMKGKNIKHKLINDLFYTTLPWDPPFNQDMNSQVEFQVIGEEYSEAFHNLTLIYEFDIIRNHPNLSELTPYQISSGLTHLGSEASI